MARLPIQAPPLHQLLLSQFVSVVQLERHAPDEHAYPAQVCELWGGPEATFVQVPTLPVMSHAWQLPVHAVEQQMPSTQLPLLHSSAMAHVAPSVFLGTHEPTAQ